MIEVGRKIEAVHFGLPQSFYEMRDRMIRGGARSFPFCGALSSCFRTDAYWDSVSSAESKDCATIW